METSVEVRGSKLRIRFSGRLSLSEQDVLRFYPQISELLNEIKERGWSYGFHGIEGEAIAEVDLKETMFSLHYYAPRLERLEEEGKYAIEAFIGPKEPNLIEVLSIKGFEISIGTKHAWGAVSIDPLKGEITNISGFLGWFRREGDPSKLKEAREVYEVAKWAVKDKGLRFGSRYVEESYKELVDMFERAYKFKMNLELTVEDEDKVPSWEELCRDLASFFLERGMLLKVEREGLFGKRPIP